MNSVEFEGGAICVDASVIAEGLGLKPEDVQLLMRNGSITSVCERGEDEDAGRYRLTFFHQRRRLQLVVSETGAVIESIADPAERQAIRPKRGHVGRLRTRT